ncbi:hypothetical protein GOP47_0009566 [Adiantum capillus-veneris]|uniref:Uncharacterized protein n=1 Tax=Adiantum capillus-veneris TaxID=13818 RepID=A0A9D4ZJS7_ADICA|nr:hypothetical protein GOP47_0009566 [Adiantum capillus-veneris]
MAIGCIKCCWHQPSTLYLDPASRSSRRWVFQRVTCSSQNMEHGKPFKLLFVEMGVGYDQHGQDITEATIRACKNAISSNSIPAFRTGAIPGVSWQEMKLKLKLGVPKATQNALDIEKVKAIFP